MWQNMFFLTYVSRYLYSYPSIHGISRLAAGGAWEPFEVHPKMTIDWTHAMIERVWRFMWRPRSSELRDALWGHDRASLEMQLETEIEWTQRCNWRPWSSEIGDSLGGHDRASLERHLEAKVEWTQRYTLRSWSSEFWDVIGDRDWVNSEMH